MLGAWLGLKWKKLALMSFVNFMEFPKGHSVGQWIGPIMILISKSHRINGTGKGPMEGRGERMEQLLQSRVTL
jgi:hypothetical protein